MQVGLPLQVGKEFDALGVLGKKLGNGRRLGIAAALRPRRPSAPARIGTVEVLLQRFEQRVTPKGFATLGTEAPERVGTCSGDRQMARSEICVQHFEDASACRRRAGAIDELAVAKRA